MVLELVLVAAVVGLVGVAVYQSSHRANPTASVSTKTTASSAAAGAAVTAAAAVVQDSTADAELSTSADATAGEVTASDTDAANLGDTLDADTF